MCWVSRLLRFSFVYKAFDKLGKVGKKSTLTAVHALQSGDMDKFLDYVWKLYDPEYQDTQKFLMIKKQAEHYHDKYGFKYRCSIETN